MLYERELRKAGVPTKIEVYSGVPHTFQRVGFAQIGAAAKFKKDAEAGFGWLFGK